MELVTVRELFKNREQYLDQKITVGGWIRSIRDSKTFGFIVVNDGSYFEPLQIVYHDTMDNFQEISKQMKLWWKALPHRIIRFRRNVIVSNISDLFRICVRERIRFRQYSEFVLRLHMRSINSFRNVILYTCIHH